MTPLPFDAIIFDIGNTLIYFDCESTDVYDHMDRAMIESLQASGIKLEGDHFLGQFKKQLAAYESERDTEFIEHTTAFILRKTLLENGLGHPEPGVIDAALRARYAVSQACWKTEEGALPVLESLLQAGYRLAAISNAGDDTDVQTLIDNARLRPYFELIVTSAAQGIRKPNPRIFLDALKRLGVKPGRAAMVGDTLGADILGAHNAGLFAIWLTRRANKAANRDHLDTIQADAILASIGELPAFLDRLAVDRMHSH